MLRITRNNFLSASFSRTFLVTFVFVTLAAGLFWLDFFRSYSAEVTVLTVSKSATIETSADVAANMAALTETLAFYDRVLAGNDLIDDDFVGYSPDERKDLWHALVSVTKEDGSGVLIVRARSDTPEKAKRLARETAQTMFAVAGLYYNVKTDIDMRMVDGPLVSYVLDRPFLYGGASVLSGLSVTALFFFLLRTIPELMGRKKEKKSSLDEYLVSEKASFDEVSLRRAYPEFGVGDAVPWIDPRKFIPSKPHELSYENRLQEENISEERAVYGVKHAQAPMNLPGASDEMDLPVADEASLPFEFETPEEDNNTVLFPAEEEVSLPVPAGGGELPPSEPTQEEYKRRLNELLANGEK